MGFCYPGKGKTGDLPLRKECAPEWHNKLLEEMPKIKLVILIGSYAQRYYLGSNTKKNLTETVRHYLDYISLPHPSPSNRFWFNKNPWFTKEIVPVLKIAFAKAIS